MKRKHKHTDASDSSLHVPAEAFKALRLTVAGLWQRLEEDVPSLIREAVREEARFPKRESAEGPLLTKEEVAELLQVSPRTVDTLAASGDLQRLKIRGCVRFAPSAVDAYIRGMAAVEGRV